MILAILGLVLIFLPACESEKSDKTTKTIISKEQLILIPDDEIHTQYAGSETCKECHEAAFKSWPQSNHGLAEREVSKDIDEKAFSPKQTITHGDVTTDTYHTAMAEMSVGCEACPGPMKAHVDWQKKPPLAYGKNKGKTKDPTVRKFSRDQMVETCAACHARRGEISGDLIPGESFYDHFSITVADSTDIYHPDGQVRDEEYEYASLISSKMYHAGVRCVDCHDPHSRKRLAQGNMLCMRCHENGAAPSGLAPAPVIDPIAHSHHAAASTGNDCTSCHMPVTTYMQRHPRHDHGLTSPDPLLTKQFGTPNACNRCHTDKRYRRCDQGAGRSRTSLTQ